MRSAKEDEVKESSEKNKLHDIKGHEEDGECTRKQIRKLRDQWSKQKLDV